MMKISQKAKATLETDPCALIDFFALAPVVARFLGQAEARIFALDLGLGGDTIEYRTDLGDLALHRPTPRTLCLTCDTLRRGDRETGRQLCFQLTRRLLSRYPVRVVHWHATQQRLEAERFSWGRLRDLPQRFARPEIHLVSPVHSGTVA